MQRKELEDIVHTVIFDKQEYPVSYLRKFGVTHNVLYNARNGRRPIKNLTFATVLKLVKAYKK